MTIRKTMSISISSELLAVAEGLLATGRYGNISDVMRSAPRHLEERELDFQAHRDKRASNPSKVVGDRASEQDRNALHV